MTPVRKLLAMCATSGLLVFAGTQAYAALSRDIAAQPLAQALSEFATQTGLQVVYVSGIVASHHSRGTPDGLSAVDALEHLLQGTGLRFEFLNDRTVRIFAGSSCAVPPNCAGPSRAAGVRVPEAAPTAPAPNKPLEEVIVNGLRWWLDPTRAVGPLVLLDRRDMERGAANSIGDVLQSLPMTTGSPLNANANAPGSAEERGGRGAAGDGSVRVRLHDLPTVVLLNGRRLPNSGLGADASVDLNTLPVSLIERVEVLAGPSTAVGADAVGGVVNVVTRHDNRALELGATRTISERGDGEIVTAQAAIGFDLFGGAWNVGLDFVEQDGVTMDRRRYSARPLIVVDAKGTVKAEGLYNTPVNSYIDVPEGNALGLEPGVYTHVPGSSGLSAADYRRYDRATDGFNPAPFNYSQTPNERTALWLLGSRPLGDSTNLFLEAFVHHRESAQQAAPEYFSPDLVYSFVAPPDGLALHPADNYYNPFGVDLDWGVRRRLIEAGNRRTEQQVDLWRALVGFEGRVAGWTWEVALQGASADAAGVESGFLAPSRVARALGPSGLDASGRIVCGAPDAATGRVPAASIIPDCVPLNVFGGAGSITQEQLEYVMPARLINRGRNEQQLAELVLSGPAGRLLGRHVQWVLGADYRREAGSVVPRTPIDSDYKYFRFSPPVHGAYGARELFGAVQVPLLHDLPWARDSTLDIGLRWSDFYSFDSHTSWHAGLRWQPTQELTLRASYGEVFRAPSLAELHEVPYGFDEWFETDPCGNDPTPAQRANCAAAGVPGGEYVQQDAGFRVAFGGNPELEPETGHTFGAGLIYTPAWSRGLLASVDYFQERHTNHIAGAHPHEILYECAEHGGSLCEAITRLPDGRVSRLSATFHNFGASEVRAFDFAIAASAMTRVGEVKSRLLATYLDRWDRQPFPGGETYSYAGNYDAGARPRWRATGHVDWYSGPWTASYAAEYIGSYSERVEPWPPFGIEFEPFDRRVDPVLYHDVEAAFRFGSGITIRAGITNVTDEDPPYLNIAPANTDVSTYRLLGRSYFLDLRYRVEH